ncbi:hypothetical protein DFH11DRAFT_1725774 [Phellopilus nigrolimitatus]|nr:hypothetical protein DFH11DRAFT_1725774 [Phellopilus nigrolimitatus]
MAPGLEKSGLLERSDTATVRRPLVRALELYAKYPLFVHASSSSSTSLAPHTKSNANLATSCAPAFSLVASTSASRSPSTKSATTFSDDAHSGASALTLPGVNPEPYADKRRAAPAREPAHVEPGRASVSSADDAQRQRGERQRLQQRSAGASGSVHEEGDEGEAEGTWHRPAEETNEDVMGASRGERREKKGKSKAEMSAPERRQMNMEARNWTYDNVKGPVYDAMPAVPIKQTLYQEVFFPGPRPATSTSLPTSLPTASIFATKESAQGTSADEKPYIEISALHARDIELARRAIRKVGSRRGEHRGHTGLWVENEWEVAVIPELKKLFLRQHPTYVKSPSDPDRAVRPGFGKRGTPVAVRTNFFALKYPKDLVLYDYPVVIAPDGGLYSCSGWWRKALADFFATVSEAPESVYTSVLDSYTKRHVEYLNLSAADVQQMEEAREVDIGMQGHAKGSIFGNLSADYHFEGRWMYRLPKLYSISAVCRTLRIVNLSCCYETSMQLLLGSLVKAGGVVQVFSPNLSAQPVARLLDREQDALVFRFQALAEIAVRANFFALKYPKGVVLRDY